MRSDSNLGRMHFQNDQINNKQKSTKGMTKTRERREGRGVKPEDSES